MYTCLYPLNRIDQFFDRTYDACYDRYLHYFIVDLAVFFAFAASNDNDTFLLEKKADNFQ